MEIIIAAVVLVALVALVVFVGVATFTEIARDGYRAVPTRHELARRP